MRRLISLHIIVLTAILSATALHCSADQTHLRPENHSQLEEAISSATNYLVNAVNEDGTFIYRVNMDPTVEVQPSYNILRHAGAIYSLTMCDSVNHNASINHALKVSGTYLRDEALGPIDNNPKILTIWSKPEVNRTGAPLQSKLGGAGLGLVALTSLKQRSPDFIELERLQALGAFIVAMQKKDGNFYSKFVPSEGGKTDKWISLYYPGEAALGLVMLCELDNKAIWLKSAVQALGYLASSRKGQETVPADHWALLATAALFKLCEERDIKIPRPLLEAHALQVCQSMIRQQTIYSHDPKLTGGFSPDGRTTPSATRLEGLIATLTWLPKEHPSHPLILASVESGIDFLLRAQIKEGPFKGGFPRSVKRLPDTPENVNFNERAPEIRIDYVQHAVSALLQYTNLMAAESSSESKAL